MSNRLTQRGQPPKGRVPVRGGIVRSRSERVDDVLRRPNLRIPAPKINDRLLVQGGSRRQLYLDEYNRVRLRPDLSWWEAQRCVFVGDVKYKRIRAEGIEHPDLYQLLAYLVAAKLSEGLLIYSAEEQEPRSHEVRHLGRRLRIVTIDVQGQPEEILQRVGVIAQEIRGLRDLARVRAA